ncbi:ArsR/SmtB family transcription factor [Alkaliphilus peptidifermentans]|uniref:DNA-binding transcriptional regulator, ArsR family n=1 Tax=Alkaliphilus peptidifermentans DSM 18978 TaxID=1120976 RepID=A0A1G5K4U8_9FIRM|nr:metalloregulator ArsR/SmtB family transcription factor [Alkaliphilus peptidifermentans]SCY95251.1 DNA-binding transcriptional regulator, ArsR family [Alkaliphilus peptidifermentans DSM 18978]
MSGINENRFDIEVIKALSDETRLEILFLIGKNEMNVNEIANNCRVSRPTISHHLQIMKRSGILTSRKEGKEIYYSTNMYKLTSLAESILYFVGW